MSNVLATLRPAVKEFRLFLWLRRRQLGNAAHAVADQSAVRLLSILAASLIVWVFVYVVSHSGFHWIASWQKVPAFGGIVGLLFDFMFVSLGVMLIFSTALILYSSLFASAEAKFLLATPARDDQVFAYKYLGAVGFSSWGFLLLGSPVLLAYGVVYGMLHGMHWAFFALLPFFFVGFVLLPGCLGALACLLVVNYIPKHGKQITAAGVLVLLALGAWWFYRAAASTGRMPENREMVNRLLGRLDLSQTLFAPTHWMTRGLQLAGQGHLLRTPRGTPGSLYYLALLWSNGLLFYVLTTWAAARLYRRGFNRVATGGTLRRRYGGRWLDRLLDAGLGFLDPQTRLLIVKDFRAFRRDPAQWAQILIFTGLLMLYFWNIRRLFISDVEWTYQNAISLLNVTTTGLFLCIYTGRFIFPMLSLEGRKFWVLGLLPLRRERLLWGKFAFSATGGLLISEVLVLLSDAMLDMPPLAVGLHMLTVAVLAVGLSGLSVGLGACMPTFKETDPSKIAAGFGGTLNLVAGMFFLIAAVGLIALPWHVYGAAMNGPAVGGVIPLAVCGTGALLGVATGVAAVILPLKAGAEALRRMEF